MQYEIFAFEKSILRNCVVTFFRVGDDFIPTGKGKRVAGLNASSPEVVDSFQIEHFFVGTHDDRRDYHMETNMLNSKLFLH